MRIALVGAGTISSVYAETLGGRDDCRIVRVVDRNRDRAAELSARIPGSTVAVDAAMADDVDLVLNLTVPASHAAVTLAALRGGKHVYSEKPLGTEAIDVSRMPDAAGAAGVRLGCAPDTMLGTGFQTARRAVLDGAIGDPVAAHAVMVTPGHERWHPMPEFYYRAGGGALLDMGPYYLTALVQLLGPVRWVAGRSSRPRPVRQIGRGPRAGTEFTAELDTHEVALLEHDGGALTTLVMSFDAVATSAPPIEVHGTAASMTVPDPNHFEGAVGLRRRGDRAFETLPVSAGYVGAARGIGVVDLIAAATTGAAHRTGADLAAHVLDVLLAIRASAAENGRPRTVTTTFALPDPVPLSTTW